MNKTDLKAKISIKYVLPTCIWKHFWRISQYFAVFRENTWISRVRDCAKYQKPCQVFTLQRRFIFSGFHRIIELKTSKHEFADIIQKNKQGFEGKKLSEGQAGRNSLRFDNMCCRLRRIGDRHARFKLFSYLDFRVCFACYPPESFKIIWLVFGWNSSIQAFILRKKSHIFPTSKSPGAIFSNFEKSLREAQNSPGAGIFRDTCNPRTADVRRLFSSSYLYVRHKTYYWDTGQNRQVNDWYFPYKFLTIPFFLFRIMLTESSRWSVWRFKYSNTVVVLSWKLEFFRWMSFPGLLKRLKDFRALLAEP